jgi:cysteine desulfurase
MVDRMYLDYAATTPVDRAVADAMCACLRSTDAFANPSSATHAAGRRAAEVVERARDQVAGLINAAPSAIIWTSGATEADNLALIGAARFRAARGKHLVTAVTEHPAVLDSCRFLETQGYEVTYLRPDHLGILDPEAVGAAIRDDTIIVSIMHVNNEIGVVQDIDAIGSLCGERDVLFHVDAAQSAGRLPINVREQRIDMLSLSAHKMHGPKGVGALYLNPDRIRRVAPLLHGGGQERGLRPGTLPTHQLLGMGLAFELAAARMAADTFRINALRDRLWEEIGRVSGVLLNGHPERRACHVLSVSVIGAEGESLRFGLRDLGISGGSACASDSAEPSAVLRCLGRSDQLAYSTVRFSIGRTTTEAEVDFAATRFVDTVARLRELVPVSKSALA